MWIDNLKSKIYTICYIFFTSEFKYISLINKRSRFELDCDKILQTDGGSIITGLRCFSLPLILDCGQAFRWSENADGSWSGVAMNRELRLKQDGDRLFF